MVLMPEAAAFLVVAAVAFGLRVFFALLEIERTHVDEKLRRLAARDAAAQKRELVAR